MNAPLKININENQEQTVSGRELHAFLEVETPYHKWFPRMCEYGFDESIDYLVTDKNVHNSNGGRQSMTDHILKLDMAKELCMLARNDKGKQARHYFLQVEREWNSPEKVMARALQIATQKLTETTKQLEEAKPKVIFADAVSASSSTMLIGELAKLIRQNGYPIGEKRLFEWLRENGYLIKRKGSDYNKPSQRYVEMGLFRIKENTIVHSDGHVTTSTTTKVTGKGQQYFINKFIAPTNVKGGVQNA